MKWLHRVFRRGSTPPVPDDKSERQIALARAQSDLVQIKAAQPHIDEVAAKLQLHIDQNHFANRLEQAYGMRR